MDKIVFGIEAKDNASPVFKNFEKSIERAGKQAKSMTNSLSTLASGGIAKLGAAIAVGAVAKFTADTLESLDAQKKFAQSVGASTGNVIGLGYAASLGGSSIEGMQTGMIKLAKTMDEANKKGGKSVFSELGIAIKDAQGQLRSTDEVMIDVADKFASMQDGTAKATLAMDLFGKKGAELIPVLNQGSEALRKQVNEGKILSGVSGDNIANFEEFNDAITTLKTGAGGLVAFIATQMAPALKAFAELIRSSTEDLVAMAIIAENAAKSEKLKLESIEQNLAFQIAKYEESKRLGYSINAQQQEHLNKLKESLVATRQQLGLSENEMRLQNAKQRLNALSWAEREKFGKLDSKDAKERRTSLEKEIKLLTEKVEKEKRPARVESAGDIEARIEEERRAKEELRRDTEQKEKERASEIESRQKKYLEQEEATWKAEQLRMTWRQEQEEKYAKENEDSDKKEWTRRQLISSFQQQQEEDKIKALEDAEKLEEQQHQERLQMIEDERNARIAVFQSVSQFASSFNSTISKLNQASINNVQSEYKTRTAELEAHYAKEIELAGGNKARIDALNSDLAAKKSQLAEQQAAEEQAIKKKTFGIEQSLSIVEATMNGAVAITQALASAPPPFNYALAASVGVATAAEIALIKSQKLAAGGSAIGRNAIVMMNEKGEEKVLNAEATKTAGNSFVQSLNSGKSMQEALSSAGRGYGSMANVTINVSGFIDSPKTADYIVAQVQKVTRQRR